MFNKVKRLISALRGSTPCPECAARVKLPERDYAEIQDQTIQTLSGVLFDVFNPRPQDLRLGDIARALSNLTRFGGQIKNFYGVAQHSVLVSLLCPPHLATEGLLHDAAEAYLLDMPRPIKHHPKFAFYRELEENIQKCLATRFSLKYPFPDEVKKADGQALALEMWNLTGGCVHPKWRDWVNEKFQENPRLEKTVLKPLSPGLAYLEFQSRCDVLGLDFTE